MDNQLTEEQFETIKRFLELNNVLNKIGKDGTLEAINSLVTDSIIRKRQHNVYKTIPEIVKDRNELVEYLDVIPIHMRYWDIRNKAMVQNILKQIKLNPNKVIVVLNGFYHRYYLIDELKKYEDEYKFYISTKQP